MLRQYDGKIFPIWSTPHGARTSKSYVSNSFAVRKNLRDVFVTFGYIGDAHWAAVDWPRWSMGWVDPRVGLGWEWVENFCF